MKKVDLIKIFCLKVNMEMEIFKLRTIAQKKEEIYGDAYRIDCVVRIYEQCVELAANLQEDVLLMLVGVPYFLEYLYEDWLKINDSSEEELESSIADSISKIMRNKEKERETDGKGNINVES